MHSGFQGQFDAFWEMLGSPVGIIGIIGMLVLMVVLVLSRRSKWGVLTALLFVSTLSFRTEYGSTAVVHLAFPIEQIRNQGRAICLALLIALLVPLVMRRRGWRRKFLVGGAGMFFLFQLVWTFRTAIAGFGERAILSAIIYVLIFLVVGIGVSLWLEDWADVHRAVRCIGVAGILFLLGTCYQLAINRSAALGNGRLYGISANPQFAGVLIAVSLPPCLYLLARRGESKLWRMALIASVGFLILLLLWTGSRTGVLAAAVGIGLLFRARLGKWVLVGLATAVFVVLALQIYGESAASGMEHVLDTTNTRSAVWHELLHEFQESPLWGQMDEYDVQENSYLSTAAHAGLFGLAPLLLVILLVSWTLLKLQRLRRHLGEHALVADLVIAGLTSIGVAAIFEGILLGTLTISVFAIYIYLAIAAFLLDAVAAGNLPGAERAPLPLEHYGDYAEPAPASYPASPLEPVEHPF
jgi:hypothetical protein